MTKPTMTSDNIRDFHIVTGEYDPGWQERETTKAPVELRMLNQIWEHHVRTHVLPLVQRAEEKELTILAVHVPKWVYMTWREVYGDGACLLGYPMLCSEQPLDGYSLSCRVY